ncbi:MAG: adenosylcobinamide-phosphate synthase CbiB [Thermoprotei archaeon]
MKVHPVVWTGKIAERLTKPFAPKAYGVVLWLAGVAPVLVPLSLLWYLPFPLSLLSVYPLKISFSISMLYSLVRRSVPFRDESRAYVQQMVRRDVTKAEPGLVRSAAIESLFESAVDGIVSPLFWFLILGLPGALLQRLANTMDSMVGYKTPELKEQGWFSARVDTVLNYVPARLTAFLLYASAKLMGLDHRISPELRKEAASVESPNARVVFLAVSSILRVRLEKKGHYVVGSAFPYPADGDVLKALKLFKVSLILFLVLEFIGIAILSYFNPLLAP